MATGMHSNSPFASRSAAALRNITKCDRATCSQEGVCKAGAGFAAPACNGLHSANKYSWASGKIQYSSEEAGYKSAGLLFQSLEGQESCQCLLYSQRHLVPASSPLFYQMTQGLAAGSLRCIAPLTGGAQLLGPDAE